MTENNVRDEIRKSTLRGIQKYEDDVYFIRHPSEADREKPMLIQEIVKSAGVAEKE